MIFRLHNFVSKKNANQREKNDIIAVPVGQKGHFLCFQMLKHSIYIVIR